jgi:hypothetical protein
VRPGGDGFRAQQTASKSNALLGAPSQRAYLLTTDPATDLLGFWDFDALMASAKA